MSRSILHCDMNNFYASVECMLDPKLKKYPVAVCGSVEERHGIVLAKNYAAKSFNVKTGDAVWQAKQKCRDLVVVPPHFEEYIKYSKLARSVYGRYTDQVEPYGMDECWLDISGILGIGRNAAYAIVKKGYFSTVRIGGIIRISKRSFDAWLDEKSNSCQVCDDT